MEHAFVLPPAPVHQLVGLLQTLHQTQGRDDVWRLASSLGFTLVDLVPLLRAAALLGLVTLVEGDVTLTDVGRALARAGERRRRVLFRERLSALPVFRAARDLLDRAAPEGISRESMRDRLVEAAGGLVSEATLDTAIDWGRYAELFDYDADTGRFLAGSVRR